MLEFSDRFNVHMKSEATRLCWCWKLTRSDGEIFGFTDHDRALEFGDVTYSASSGFTPSETDNKLGFAIDSTQVNGVLSSEQIQPEDIDAGLYDGAEVLVMRVQWDAPETRAEIWRGYLAGITKSGDEFSAELVGESSRLNRSTGRVFSRMCDAQFGDKRCGLELNDFPQGTTCSRSFKSCQDFSNSRNYRGFPYLIGDDALQAGLDTATRKDGGSRYS